MNRWIGIYKKYIFELRRKITDVMNHHSYEHIKQGWKMKSWKNASLNWSQTHETWSTNWANKPPGSLSCYMAGS